MFCNGSSEQAAASERAKLPPFFDSSERAAANRRERVAPLFVLRAYRKKVEKRREKTPSFRELLLLLPPPTMTHQR